MATIHDLTNLGQAVWLDYIRRAFIASGELQDWIDRGVRGVTSNPSIFEKAIAGSADYDQGLQRLVEEGKSDAEIYEALALEDIRRAADLLRPVYEQTDGADGYVSLEVSPTLAYDTEGTITEARRLFLALGRPNVMIKVPATPGGIAAIETLTRDGINVNVTLIFSVDHYRAVAEAYVAGLEARAAAAEDLSSVASVASVFVSRVDAVVDRALQALDAPEAGVLQGRIAIANVRIVYSHFRAIFSSKRWARLAAQGARVQRPLWASTGTKNPAYSDTRYVDDLVGPDTVSTVPPATLHAVLDHGRASLRLTSGVAEAVAALTRLAELGIDLDAITQRLQNDGVAAFVASLETLTTRIREKREQLQARWQLLSAKLGPYQEAVDAALAEIKEQGIIRRIWAHDNTVWKPEPAEITNRLGWLHSAEMMRDEAPYLLPLVFAARDRGYTHALLLGMGGSSLAPEVFRQTFSNRTSDLADRPYLDLAVLDSTDPGAVLAQAERLDPARTLFIVATKSGGTVETLSFFKFFYNRVVEAVGKSEAGNHFVAITDPDSRLDEMAKTYDFAATFLNDANVGGRYSALSYFGLVPATLVGMKVERLLERAMTMACNCDSCNCVVDGNNHGGRLGAILGELAKAGRDKLTLITSPEIGSFGDWVEQLIAESTGKEGTGIVPVVGEPVGPPEVYGDDRLFVYLRLDGDATHDATVQALEDAGQPVVRLRDRYDLGEQFFLWEMATAIAGYRLGINPFDQPNVEAAKILARQMVAAYQADGALPDDEPASLTTEALQAFLAQAQPGDYVALHAYVTPTAETESALQALRIRLRDQTRLAVTVGYGSRFLHSTGQLHKGDAGNGLFIQFTAADAQDVAIPENAGSDASSITFGALKTAQALGDKQALREAGRRVIRFHLGTDVAAGLRLLAQGLGQRAVPA